MYDSIKITETLQHALSGSPEISLRNIYKFQNNILKHRGYSTTVVSFTIEMFVQCKCSLAI